MYKPEDQAFLAETRARFAAGGLSKEEEKALLKRVVEILREGRLGAVQAARAKRAVKPSSADGDALLSELLS